MKPLVVFILIAFVLSAIVLSLSAAVGGGGFVIISPGGGGGSGGTNSVSVTNAVQNILQNGSVVGNNITNLNFTNSRNAILNVTAVDKTVTVEVAVALTNSAGLAGQLNDETGTQSVVFNDTPNITNLIVYSNAYVRYLLPVETVMKVSSVGSIGNILPGTNNQVLALSNSIPEWVTLSTIANNNWVSNSTTLANNLPVFGQGGSGVATTNISAFRGLIAAMSATNLSGVYNVLAYGATNDGTYGFQTNIQNAIDAASSAGGGIVYFPAGTYAIGTNFVYPAYTSEGYMSSLVLRSNNVYLIGDGPSSIIKMTRSQGTQYNFLGSNNTTNIGLCNLTIDGNYDGSTILAVDLTQFYYNKNVRFQNVNFINSGMDAVDTQFGLEVSVIDCTASNIVGNVIGTQNTYTFVDNLLAEYCATMTNATTTNTYAFSISGGLGVVQNSKLIRCRNFLEVLGGTQVKVDSSYFNTTNTHANATNVIVEGTATFNNVQFNCPASLTSFFVVVSTNRTANFADCKFEGRQGIRGIQPTLITVDGCTFDTGYGIQITGGTGHKISNSRFAGTANGIRFDTSAGAFPSHSVIAHGNVFTESAGYYVDNNGTNHLISGNMFIAAPNGFFGDVSARHNFDGNTMLTSTVTLESHDNELHHNNIGTLSFGFDNSTNSFFGNKITTFTGSAQARSNSFWMGFTNGVLNIGDSSGSNGVLQAHLIRSMIGTTDFGYQSIKPAINNPNVDFSYRLLSISTNANFNAVTTGASSNRISTVIYTNTASTWITGLLSAAFTWIDNAGIPASSFRLPPTNISTIRYSTDVNTNYYAEFLSSTPNLPLESLAGLESVITTGQTVRYDPTAGFTNTAWPAVGSVSSVSTDTNMSVGTPTTTPAITFTNYSGTGPFARSNAPAFRNALFSGTTTNSGTVLFNPDNTYDIGGDGVNRPAYVIAANTVTAPYLWATTNLNVGSGTLSPTNIIQVDRSKVGSLARAFTLNTNAEAKFFGLLSVESSTNAQIQFYDTTGSNYVALRPAASMLATSNYTIVFPPAPSNTLSTVIYTNSGAGNSNVQMVFNPVFYTNATLNFPQISANNSTNLVVNITGVVTNSVVTVSASVETFTNRVVYVGFVTNAGIVVVQGVNFSASTIDPPSGSFNIKVEKIP